MKYIYLSLIYLLCIESVSAQHKIERQLISPFGQSASLGSGGYKISYSTGEVATKSIRSSSMQATQGFQQPACTDCDLLVVDPPRPCGDLSIPNVITPNDDNINDRWIIKAPNVSVRVYSRWGQEVLNESMYQDNWEGKDKSGKTLPIGTYYYVLTTPLDDEPCTGSIVILRDK